MIFFFDEKKTFQTRELKSVILEIFRKIEILKMYQNLMKKKCVLIIRPKHCSKPKTIFFLITWKQISIGNIRTNINRIGEHMESPYVIQHFLYQA